MAVLLGSLEDVPLLKVTPTENCGDGPARPAHHFELQTHWLLNMMSGDFDDPLTSPVISFKVNHSPTGRVVRHDITVRSPGSSPSHAICCAPRWDAPSTLPARQLSPPRFQFLALLWVFRDTERPCVGSTPVTLAGK